jgi:hypothetical protein
MMAAHTEHLQSFVRPAGSQPGRVRASARRCLSAALVLTAASLCWAQPPSTQCLDSYFNPLVQATVSITAPCTSGGNYTINSGASAVFQAGGSIVLQPGFRAATGSLFRASIVPQASQPTFTPVPSTYPSGTQVTLSTTVPGGVIRYTTDGVTVPSETVGTVYTASIPLTRPITIQAITYAAGWLDSPISRGVFSVPETITAPSAPSPSTATARTATTFTSGGATSNWGHPVEYQYTWGDGTAASQWSSAATATHTWTTAGTYTVTVQARCATDPSILSPVSGTTVTVAPAPDFTVSVQMTSPASGTVAAGGTGHYTVTVTPGPGYNQMVYLGVTPSWPLSPVWDVANSYMIGVDANSNWTATLSVAVSSNALPNGIALNIAARTADNSINHQITAVVAIGTQTMSVSVSPSYATVAAGGDAAVHCECVGLGLYLRRMVDYPGAGRNRERRPVHRTVQRGVEHNSDRHRDQSVGLDEAGDGHPHSHPFHARPPHIEQCRIAGCRAQ